MSYQKKAPAGEGPWPATSWHAAKMLEAGGTVADVEALRWVPLGTRRRNLLEGLILFRRYGNVIVPAFVSLLQLQVGQVRRFLLFAGVEKQVPAEVSAKISRKGWAFFLEVTLIMHPELEERMYPGKEGSYPYVRALRRSGWGPEGAPALTGELFTEASHNRE